MIGREITEETLRRADSYRHTAIIAGSQLGHEANYKGAVGEALFYEIAESLGLAPEWVASSERGYDFNTRAGTVEVKTKERRYKPEPYHEASIPVSQAGRQMPDWFAFVSLVRPGSLREFSRGFLVGVMRPAYFFKNAYFVPEGTPMGSGRLSWIGMWNMEIADLRPESDLLDAVESAE